MPLQRGAFHKDKTQSQLEHWVVCLNVDLILNMVPSESGRKVVSQLTWIVGKKDLCVSRLKQRARGVNPDKEGVGEWSTAVVFVRKPGSWKSR